MNLDELVDAIGFVRTGPSVPDWTLGCFRRRSITYFTGQEDTTTQVYWMQSRGLTADLRVRSTRPALRQRGSEAQCQPHELRSVTETVEGGLGLSRWTDGEMAWSDWTSFQLHNRWPEPARLTRVGNCLVEFAPSGAYVEDWRAQPVSRTVLVGLRLEQERLHPTGQIRHRGGGLLVAGSHAMLVRGRPEPPDVRAGARLPDVLDYRGFDRPLLSSLFSCEVSYALRYGPPGERLPTIQLSTHPWREGKPLGLDGFEPGGAGQVVQWLEEDGDTLERTFTIDTLERLYLPYDTEPRPDGAAWFEQERGLLIPHDDR